MINQINFNSNSIYNKYSQSFTGGTLDCNKLLIENKNILSKKTVKLIAALNDCIDSTWKDIKNKNIIAEKPSYTLIGKKQLTTITPIYTQTDPMLLLEHETGKVTDRIIINRKNPNIFRYEKSIKTDHGSATIKTFDSTNCTDREIISTVDEIIEKDLRQLISNKILRKYFYKSDFSFKNTGIELK